jgi:hypothetical protein
MLSVTQTKKRRIIGGLMTDKLEGIWKEAVLSRHLSERTEEMQKKPVRTAIIRAEIWTRDLPNTKQDC